MPRVTFSAERGVHISVRGEGPDDRHVSLDDGGLVSELLAWEVALYKTSEGPVHHVACGGMCGGGRLSQVYVPDDADRVVRWLREHGAVEVVASGYKDRGKVVRGQRAHERASQRLVSICERAGFDVERTARDVYTGRLVLELRERRTGR